MPTQFFWSLTSAKHQLIIVGHEPRSIPMMDQQLKLARLAGCMPTSINKSWVFTIRTSTICLLGSTSVHKPSWGKIDVRCSASKGGALRIIIRLKEGSMSLKIKGRLSKQNIWKTLRLGNVTPQNNDVLCHLVTVEHGRTLLVAPELPL